MDCFPFKEHCNTLLLDYYGITGGGMERAGRKTEGETGGERDGEKKDCL